MALHMYPNRIEFYVRQTMFIVKVLLRGTPKGT